MDAHAEESTLATGHQKKSYEDNSDVASTGYVRERFVCSEMGGRYCMRDFVGSLCARFKCSRERETVEEGLQIFFFLFFFALHVRE